jgi:hypothetical protein
MAAPVIQGTQAGGVMRFGVRAALAMLSLAGRGVVR